jgi:hypothetical protein
MIDTDLLEEGLPQISTDLHRLKIYMPLYLRKF